MTVCFGCTASSGEGLRFMFGSRILRCFAQGLGLAYCDVLFQDSVSHLAMFWSRIESRLLRCLVQGFGLASCDVLFEDWVSHLWDELQFKVLVSHLAMFCQGSGLAYCDVCSGFGLASCDVLFKDWVSPFAMFGSRIGSRILRCFVLGLVLECLLLLLL